ncbi:MAG: SdpI family protein [Mucilaginibacter sp.]
MKKSLINAVSIAIWLLPIIYLLIVYSALPATVPLHYGLNGKPNGFGDKSKFLAIQVFIAFIFGGTYLLVKNISKFDKNQAAKFSQATFEKAAMGILLFSSTLSIGLTLSTVNGVFKGDKLIFPVVGLLFAFLGNLMYNVKQNHFFGVRLPWTLKSEDNWRATHRLTGKLWFLGGLLITALALFLPASAAGIAFIVCMSILCAVPIIYSYVYYKKHQV